MSTQVIAEYPEEGIAILRDGSGIFLFDRSNSILPIDDDHPLSLRTEPKSWRKPSQEQSSLQDEEDEFYLNSMH